MAKGRKGHGSRSSDSSQPCAATRGGPWKRCDGAVVLSLIGLWASLPPLNWWPFAWLFPLGWIRAVSLDELPGRRPYLRVWLWGGIFWMVVLQGVRLAHWANHFYLPGLGLYFGAFWPLFLGAARSLHHRFRWPLPLAMACAWAGMEWLRGQGPVGFSGACLAHSQANLPTVIQISDIAGGYLLGWLMVLVSTSAAAALWTDRPKARIAWVMAAIGMVAFDLGYGWFRLSEQAKGGDVRSPLRVALIQGSIDTDFGADPSRPERMLRQYSELTYQARREYGTLDLIVWPESMFPIDMIVLESDAPVLADGLKRDELLVSQDNFRRLVRNLARAINLKADGTPVDPPTWFVLGTGVVHVDEQDIRQFNSALLFDPQGELKGRYDKMHPVLFGEYLPFGNVLPWLYRLTPMRSGLTAGERPESFTLRGWRLAPSICFESTVPHLIREQVAELVERGESPDLLLNITNDGWFWGSSILDIQLHCGVFRAVENRRAFLVAANTGISAWVDSNGRLLARGPRRDTTTLLAQPAADGRVPAYHWVGDWPWGMMFAAGLAALALSRRRRSRAN